MLGSSSSILAGSADLRRKLYAFHQDRAKQQAVRIHTQDQNRGSTQDTTDTLKESGVHHKRSLPPGLLEASYSEPTETQAERNKKLKRKSHERGFSRETDDGEEEIDDDDVASYEPSESEFEPLEPKSKSNSKKATTKADCDLTK